MVKPLLDNITGIAGEAIKLLTLIVTGVVLLDRVKNATRDLNTRMATMEHLLPKDNFFNFHLWMLPL
jgi:hypothetical protein